MELVANWGARRVFITSTFQDMQAERDASRPSRSGCAAAAGTWNGSTSASAPATRMRRPRPSAKPKF
jgi:hypothetical protein